MQKWAYCQKLLNPGNSKRLGNKKSILLHVQDSNLEAIDPELAAMASEILERYSGPEIEEISLEVGEVYRWSADVIEKMRTRGRLVRLQKEALQEKQRALRLRRQRQILGIDRRADFLGWK